MPLPPTPASFGPLLTAERLIRQQARRRALQQALDQVRRTLPATARLVLVCQDADAPGDMLVVGAPLPDLVRDLQRHQADAGGAR